MERGSPGISSGEMSPHFFQPVLKSQVEARATGTARGLFTVRGDVEWTHPSNAADDEQGSSAVAPTLCPRCAA